jgi:RNA polymerase sigma-70 factor (ECF subfamily)
MSLKEFRSKLEVKNKKIYAYIENDKLKIEEIMADYTNYIYTIIRNFNTNLSNEDIEEIVLDVFLTLWKNQYKLDINKNISSYIGGITKNLIKYKCRQNKIILNIDDYEEQLIDLKNIELFLIQDEKKKIIITELEKIKPEEKDIFISYYYYDNSIKEISNKLNISESNVKIKLFRIRKKINKVLKERGYSSNEK